MQESLLRSLGILKYRGIIVFYVHAFNASLKNKQIPEKNILPYCGYNLNLNFCIFRSQLVAIFRYRNLKVIFGERLPLPATAYRRFPSPLLRG
jgi:hypothetical protein